MSPRLICIAGPHKGATFPLSGSEFSIGRGLSNPLAISDSTLSRRHCSIQAKDGQFQVNDLESRNGTFVNRLPVKERLLEHGDEILAGHSRFLFLLHEAEPQPAHPAVTLDEGKLAEYATVSMQAYA